jgi:hypothetical protein
MLDLVEAHPLEPAAKMAQSKSQKAEALCGSGGEPSCVRRSTCRSGQLGSLGGSWLISSIAPSGRGQIVEVERRFFELKKGRQ